MTDDNRQLATVDKRTGELVAQPTWTPDQVQLIKDTVAVDTTDDEFKLFLYQCGATGLNPLLKQAYCIKRWNAGLGRMACAFQTGIDGFRVVADRTGNYAGQDEPKFVFGESNTIPEYVTVTVYRMIGGQRVGFAATAYYSEYVQTKKDGHPNSMWTRMPKSQLAKCAESLALRKAFPQDLSGIYTADEMGQADNDAPPQLPPPTTQRPPDRDPPPSKFKVEVGKLSDHNQGELIDLVNAAMEKYAEKTDAMAASDLEEKALKAKVLSSPNFLENTELQLAEYLVTVRMKLAQLDAPSNGPDHTNPPVDFERTMESKYDNVSKCNFCGKKHVKPGDTIGLYQGKWGSIHCGHLT